MNDQNWEKDFNYFLVNFFDNIFVSDEKKCYKNIRKQIYITFEGF